MIEGDKELIRALRGLGEKMGPRVMRRALRKGARPIRDAARVRAPRRTSQPPRKQGQPLHKTIVVRSARKRRGHDEVSVKVTHTRDGAHAHLVEYGTAARTRSDGASSGVMPAQPYMRPAYDATKDTAWRIVRAEVERGLEEAVR